MKKTTKIINSYLALIEFLLGLILGGAPDMASLQFYTIHGLHPGAKFLIAFLLFFKNYYEL